ncbi:MAG: hypothetical protein IT159_10100 [Bryobacterales bacterium]|nr:hypothetical protein [Bryobacterales bacterium]
MSDTAGRLLAHLIRYSPFYVETVLVLLLVRRALLTRQSAAPRWLRWERRLSGFSRRRGLAVATVGVLALAGRAALALLLPTPEPGISDEFSYLLAADTFASGHLANPPHPMWVHFETMHVNQHPTYASMYPPAQGMVLALGQTLFGRPWWGVWLSSGLMCAALCWMLQGWLPPLWAFLGGLLAVLRLGLFSYWAGSYWGGAVAAIGGALVLGALARIRRRPRAIHAALLAFGAGLLAASRPYEGLLLCIPASVAAVAWTRGRQRTLGPAGVVLLAAAAALGYYNWRVTGDPLRMPYQVNREAYPGGRYFVWDPPPADANYRHASMNDFYVRWQKQRAEAAGSLAGFLANGAGNLGVFWVFFLGPALTVPLVAAYPVVRDRRTRFLAVTGAVCAAGLAANIWFYPHYAAPATVLIYALVLQSLRHVRFARGRRSPAVLATLGIPALCLAMAGVRLAAQPLSRFLTQDHPAAWYNAPPGNLQRAAVLRQLEQLDGRHLVLVRYSPRHNWFEEWVYNRADIDRAKVVWAHEMDEPHNRELLAYFAGRKAWLMEPDETPPRLSAYPSDPQR